MTATGNQIAYLYKLQAKALEWLGDDLHASFPDQEEWYTTNKGHADYMVSRDTTDRFHDIRATLNAAVEAGTPREEAIAAAEAEREEARAQALTEVYERYKANAEAYAAAAQHSLANLTKEEASKLIDALKK